MKQVRSPEAGRWGRRSLAGAGLVAALLAVAAIAWACTQQIGTLKVCSPVPLADLVGGSCASKTGNGSQVGSVTASAGNNLSVTATNMNSSPYSILYSNPTAVANNTNCHTASTTGGITSLIGYTNGSPNTLMGPNFSAGTHVSTLTGGSAVTVPSGGGTGPAKICVQDEPNRVTGNQIVMSII